MSKQKKDLIKLGKSDSYLWFKIKITEKRGYEGDKAHTIDIEDRNCRLSVDQLTKIIKSACYQEEALS